MAQKIQIRRDTAANWTSVNPTLAQGEMGYETNTGLLKFGDGTTAWNSLGYFAGTAGTLSSIGTLLQTASVDSVLDADSFNFYDAVDAILKKITWTNIKATLKTYFDTVYTTTAAVTSQISTALSGYLTAAAAAGVYETIANVALKQSLINAATALVDAASMDLTAIKHTLSSSSATRTFTISYAGDDIMLEVTLSATGAVYTFPATALCVSEGVSSGDNTLTLAGVSGDKYIIAIKKVGSAYYVVSKNFGQ